MREKHVLGHMCYGPLIKSGQKDTEANVIKTMLKHCRKHISNSVRSNFDTREHFNYNMVNFTSTVVNC